MDKNTLIDRLNQDLAGEFNARTNGEMLEAVLATERKAVSDYTTRAVEADQLGDKGLAVQLEGMVRDESNHSEETERILQDWPL